MSLQTSKVYKCLEKKTLIMGFEIAEVFILSFLTAILHFVFSGAKLKLLWSFGPVIALGILLKITKRGKPDNYLLHWIRFHLSPGVYHSFSKVKFPWGEKRSDPLSILGEYDNAKQPGRKTRDLGL